MNNITLKTYDISFYGRLKGKPGFSSPQIERIEAESEHHARSLLADNYDGIRVVTVSEVKADS